MKPAVTAVLLLLTFSAIISTGKTKIASSFYIIFYTHNQTVSLHQVNRSKCMTTRKCFHPPSNVDRINLKKSIVSFFKLQRLDLMETAFGMLFFVKHGTANAVRQMDNRVRRACAVPFTTNAELRSPIATSPSAVKLSGANVTKKRPQFSKSGEN